MTRGHVDFKTNYVPEQSVYRVHERLNKNVVRSGDCFIYKECLRPFCSRLEDQLIGKDDEQILPPHAPTGPPYLLFFR